MTSSRMSLVLATLAPLALPGCGTTLLSSRASNPVIQDFAHRWLSNDSVLSTTASRRLALMSHRRSEHGGYELTICAEPPPDVGETFAKALAAKLELAAPVDGATGTAEAAVDNRIATAIAPLMARTQGLQVMRDSAFTLCVDRMNGWIDDEAYVRIKEERFARIAKLIEMELPLLAGRVATIRAEGLQAPPLPPSATPQRDASPPGAAASGAAAEDRRGAP